MNNFYFAGINLGGENTFRTSIVVLEKPGKKNSSLRVKNIYEKIGKVDGKDSDLQIKKIIKKNDKLSLFGKNIFIGVNAPLTMPPFFSCDRCCSCKRSQVKYLKKLSVENKKMLKVGKKFLPYIHRPCDAYIRTYIDSSLSHNEPMSSNNCHKAARIQFIKKALLPEYDFFEAYPKLSLLMLRKKFKLFKKQVFLYNSIEFGSFYRKHMVGVFENECLMGNLEKNKLIASSDTFAAFVLSYVAYLKYLGLVENKPLKFPKKSQWIYFPSEL